MLDRTLATFQPGELGQMAGLLQWSLEQFRVSDNSGWEGMVHEGSEHVRIDDIRAFGAELRRPSAAQPGRLNVDERTT